MPRRRRRSASQCAPITGAMCLSIPGRLRFEKLGMSSFHLSSVHPAIIVRAFGWRQDGGSECEMALRHDMDD